MASMIQLIASVLVLVLVPMALSVPIRRSSRSRSRPRSVSMYSPGASSLYGINPMLQSRALSNSHIASALYGGGVYPYAAYPGVGLGTSHTSYSSNVGANPYNPFSPFPGRLSSNYENHQRDHLGMGHSVSSRSNSYVGNNFGYPSIGNSYEHSVNVNGGIGTAYPGVYVPIGAKYGQYGSYDHMGFGGHGTYKVTPGFTQITHTQTVPNVPGYASPSVNKLRGYGR